MGTRVEGTLGDAGVVYDAATVDGATRTRMTESMHFNGARHPIGSFLTRTGKVRCVVVYFSDETRALAYDMVVANNPIGTKLIAKGRVGVAKGAAESTQFFRAYAAPATVTRVGCPPATVAAAAVALIKTLKDNDINLAHADINHLTDDGTLILGEMGIESEFRAPARVVDIGLKRSDERAAYDIASQALAHIHDVPLWPFWAKGKVDLAIHGKNPGNPTAYDENPNWLVCKFQHDHGAPLGKFSFDNPDKVRAELKEAAEESATRYRSLAALLTGGRATSDTGRLLTLITTSGASVTQLTGEPHRTSSAATARKKKDEPLRARSTVARF